MKILLHHFSPKFVKILEALPLDRFSPLLEFLHDNPLLSSLTTSCKWSNGLSLTRLEFLIVYFPFLSLGNVHFYRGERLDFQVSSCGNLISPELDQTEFNPTSRLKMLNSFTGYYDSSIMLNMTSDKSRA